MFPRILCFLSVFLPALMFGNVFCQAAEILPPTVLRALTAAKIPLESVSVVVQRLDEKTPLIEHNARQPMNPASTMKLVTTFAALDLLGPAYSWKTELLSDKMPSGERINDELTSNLYLHGSGDPSLTLEQFESFLRKLRVRGIRQISGDLILDRSAFSLPPHNPAAFDNDALRPYNVGPDALLINLNSLHFTIEANSPQQTVGTVNILAETPSEGLEISNRLKLSDAKCVDWRDKIKVVVTGKRIDFEGSFAASCASKALYLALWDANQQVGQLFRALWKELGGSFTGRVREGKTPQSAQSLAIHESRSLGEVVHDINKYSNNVMARQVFLSLDRTYPTRPATTDGANLRVQTWLAAKNIALPELVLDNGSGLSRTERISARGLAALLFAAWKSPVMPELMASLPLAGIDGTLKKRFTQSELTGRAHLKTGYLDGVRAIAGYVLDQKDRRWLVVFLMNHPKSRDGKPAMDALLEWVAEQ